MMSARYQILAEGGVWDFQERRKITRLDADAWASYAQWLTEGNSPLPADPVGQLDLATAIANRQAEIDAYAAGLRNRIIRGRSVGEMASWALKLFDAMAVAGGALNPFAAVLPAVGQALGLPATPTSYNDAIAKVRGITEAEHVGKVLSQAVPFLVAEAAIDGTRGRHCDAVAACPDVQSVVAYNWLAGWPQLAT